MSKEKPVKIPAVSKEAKIAKKDTLYIDVEDEITTVIDKVENAKSKIIAIVLPKRATTFQSLVNLKLLKKASSAVQKNIVLITSDEAIIHVAGVSQIHVASTPTSKPLIPVSKTRKAPKSVEETDNDKSDSKEKQVVGAVAKSSSVESLGDNDPIEIDNTTEATETVVETVVKKDKKLKIPDFSSFRLRLALGIGAVLLLIILWIVGFVILPKATITINTNFKTASLNALVTTSTDADEVDTEKNILPAKRAQVEKVDKLSVDATGEKNVGEKASGIMTLTNCIDDGEQKIVPAGTQFSSNSLTFVSLEQVILPPAITSGGECVSETFGLSRDVNVEAAEPGSSYNLAAQGYSASISGVRAFGSDMSGGTTKNVTVITKEDVNRAAQELSGKSKTEALQELTKKLAEQNVQAIDETFGEGDPQVVSTPSVGKESDTVEVTVTMIYSLTGVSQEDVVVILESEIQKVIEDSSQNIRDNGIDGVKFSLSENKTNAEKVLTLQTIAVIGPEIDEQNLKESIAGKSRGEIESMLEAIEGVSSVSVEYSPAWITTTPKKANKIQIVFNELDG